MKHLDNTTIHTIATAVIAAVDCAEECAYTPFDGDCMPLHGRHRA